MGRPPRIALISSSYFPHTGGVEEHVRHVAKELSRRGHHVAVWTVDRGECLGTRVVDGIEVRYLPTPLPARSVGAVLSYAGHAASAWRAWLRAYRDLRPDVLNVQCFGPNGLYALALHHWTRTPLVVSSHGETFADDYDVFGSSALLRRGLTRALTDAQAVTGCSGVVLDDLRNRFGLDQGTVVPNGIDLDEAAEATRPSSWPARGPVVLGLGRIEHNKGFDLLLRAFAELVRRATVPASSRLVIAGDGSALPGLRRLAMELGIADRVVFTGRLSRGEVAGVISDAGVVVVPSRVEAFGIVALEAWRGGAPLVMTVHGGARDFVTDGVDGLLVDPGDVPALATAMERILVDARFAAALSDAGRARVSEYQWTRVVDAYVETFAGSPAAEAPERRTS